MKSETNISTLGYVNIGAHVLARAYSKMAVELVSNKNLTLGYFNIGAHVLARDCSKMVVDIVSNKDLDPVRFIAFS